MPCPQRSELPGDAPLFGCSLSECVASVIDLNIELGLGMKPEVLGKGV